MALKWCASETDAAALSLDLYCDNELAIKQINGYYKIKSKGLRPLNDEVKILSGKFKSTKFSNVRREDPYISAVDRSLNELLDKMLEEGELGRTEKI